MNGNIGFVGGGAMAEAIMKGLLEKVCRIPIWLSAIRSRSG